MKDLLRKSNFNPWAELSTWVIFKVVFFFCFEWKILISKSEPFKSSRKILKKVSEDKTTTRKTTKLMKILVPVSGYLKLSQISEKKKLKKTKDEKKNGLQVL